MARRELRLDLVDHDTGFRYTVLDDVNTLDLDNPEDPTDRLELISAVSAMLDVLNYEQETQ